MKQFLALCLFLLLPAAAQATVTSQSTSASFTCTGGTVYPFTFPISDPTALTVIQAGTPLASTAYTIAPVNNNYANGGSVSLNTACSAGTLVLQRITPLTQPVVYTDNMPIPYKTMERGLDKLTEIDQEILLKSVTCESGKFFTQLSLGGGFSCSAPSGGGLGNGTTVLDASIFPGSSWSDKVNAAFAQCVSQSIVCTVDSRGIYLAPVMTSNITVPPEDTLILPAPVPSPDIDDSGGYQLLYSDRSRVYGQGQLTTRFMDSVGHAHALVAQTGGYVSWVILKDFAVQNYSAGAGQTALEVGNSLSFVSNSTFENLSLRGYVGISAYQQYYNRFVNLYVEGDTYGFQNVGNGNTSWSSNIFDGGKYWAYGIGGVAIYDNGVLNTYIAPDVEYGIVEFGPVSDGNMIYGGYLSGPSNMVTFDAGAQRNFVFGYPSGALDNSGNTTNNVLNSVSLGPQVTVTTYCSGTATANTTIYFLAMGGTTSTCTGAAVNLYGIVPPTLKQGQVFDLIATTTDSVGVSSLSGVVTFVTPFGATGLTCTIGTTHRCESPVGHYATATPGSLYFIQMTTQPGETLADVSVSISFR